MPNIISSTSTVSFYGDSISDFLAFGTFNQSLYRALDGKVRYAENTALIGDGSIANGRPGWDLAEAGTTVSTITKRFVELVSRDEADVVFVLMGANNYGSDGPGTGTAQDWIDRANDIVSAASAANKILVFIPPVSHHNDPIVGRDVLKAYLPTLASDRIIVPDTSAFDWQTGTNDGVHPNPFGAELLAHQVTQALAPHLGNAYDFATVQNRTVNLANNGDLAGSTGILSGAAQGYTQGVVADDWVLRRVGTTGMVTATKGVAEDGRATQVIQYDAKGEVRLTQAISLSGHVGEQYEIAISIKVIDPNNLFRGFRAWDSDQVNGILFSATENPVLASGGTGSYETILRSAKFTLTADEQNATINLSSYFADQSDAIIEIVDVMVRRVDGTPSLAQFNTVGTAENDILSGDDSGQELQGFAGDDSLTGGRGNDTLDGGIGRDKMFGGSGDDIYLVDNLSDQIYETATRLATDTYDLGGIDTVFSSVSFSIEASKPGRQFIENIELTGTAAISGTGNDLANYLHGNLANNVLNGGAGDDWIAGNGGNDRLVGGDGNDLLVGGDGADVLIGGDGADTFRFDTAPTPTSRDTVSDFQHAIDVLQLDRASFAALSDLAAGSIDPTLFTTGSAATSINHHLIYNPVSKTLSYDPDGMGGLGAVGIVRLSLATTITAEDIVLM